MVSKQILVTDSETEEYDLETVRKPSKHDLQRMARRPVQSTQGSQLMLLTVLAGAAGLLLFRWWKKRNAEEEAEQQHSGSNKAKSAQSTAGNASKSGRSPFSFDKKSHKTSASNTNKSVAAASNLVVAPPTYGSKSAAPTKPVKGNPKKNKEVRKARQQAKADKKKKGQEDDALNNLIAKRAEQAGYDLSNKPEIERYTYIDYDKSWNEELGKAYEESRSKGRQPVVQQRTIGGS